MAGIDWIKFSPAPATAPVAATVARFAGVTTDRAAGLANAFSAVQDELADDNNVA